MQWAQVVAGFVFVTAAFTAGITAMKLYSFGVARIVLTVAGALLGLYLYALTGTNEMMAEFGVTAALAWWPTVRTGLALVFGICSIALAWRVVHNGERRRRYNMSFPRRSSEQIPDADPPKNWKPGM
jgi:hypothetical protein